MGKVACAINAVSPKGCTVTEMKKKSFNMKNVSPKKSD